MQSFRPRLVLYMKYYFMESTSVARVCACIMSVVGFMYTSEVTYKLKVSSGFGRFKNTFEFYFGSVSDLLSSTVS